MTSPLSVPSASEDENARVVLEKTRRYWDGVAVAEEGRAAIMRAGFAPPDRTERAARLAVEADRLLAISGSFRRVIDFGCGDGRLSALLCPRAVALVAYDLSESMCAEAARNLAPFPHAEVRSTDGLTLDAPTGTTDLMLVLHVLETLPPTVAAAVVAEVARVLAPDGTAVLHLAADDSDARALRALHPAPGAATAAAFADPEAVAAFLIEHGLASRAVEREGPAWRVVSGRAMRDAAHPTAADCRGS